MQKKYKVGAKVREAIEDIGGTLPEDFCFQLTESELVNLKSQIFNSSKSIIDNNNWSQIVTSSKSNPENSRLQIATSSLENQNSKHRGKKYLPYVFTEQGIAMLSGLLKNKIAVQVSINIMNAFVRMRHFLKENGQVFQRLTTLEYQQIENNKKFDLVFDKLQEKQIENQRIFFDGQKILDSLRLKFIATHY